MIDSSNEILELFYEIKECQRTIEQNRIKIQLLIKKYTDIDLEYLLYNI